MTAFCPLRHCDGEADRRVPRRCSSLLVLSSQPCSATTADVITFSEPNRCSRISIPSGRWSHGKARIIQSSLLHARGTYQHAGDMLLLPEEAHASMLRRSFESKVLRTRRVRLPVEDTRKMVSANRAVSLHINSPACIHMYTNFGRSFHASSRRQLLHVPKMSWLDVTSDDVALD